MGKDNISRQIFADKAPEVLNDLASLVGQVAKEQLDMDAEVAEQLGINVAVRLAENWGGAMVYIPSNLRVNIAQRDMEMYKRFNGSNHLELAREFKCSIVWVYQVVKRVRKQLQDKQQPQLPFK